jgi:hypothetical protein
VADHRNDVGLGLLDQLAQPGQDDDDGGFSLRVFADLGASLGRVADEMAHKRQMDARLWQAVRPLPGIVVPQITTTNGLLDMPELLSPRDGYWWDVKTVTCATFTAGSVNVYLGGTGAEDSHLALVFTTAGTYQMGTGQLLVPPGERLIVKAVAVTGNVSTWLTAVEVAAWALPAYLM